ncbi:hypothetical protein [Kutzneria albida]|uniref:DUF1508 domain-containing protein n=1 Tax=Kutzneria albida DSM 43870 TaxID=1449976 RepID=W5W8K5_9PSEU|nr:hypothetical protein [Kutzneria albida]AHH94554.1 hypothetical protein KALB_1181 [Kutzneria albida DSM 43870]
MATPRFQLFASDSAVSWRFMSANNRDLGHAAFAFPDVDSCTAAIRLLCDHIASAVSTTVRAGPRHWAWRLRVGGVDRAVSSRYYERRVEAHNSCRSFQELVRAAGRPELCQMLRWR